MAKLYKRSKVTGAPWYASYTETLPNGKTRKRRISTGTPDKATAQQILAKLQSDAAVRQHGIVDPQADAVARESTRPIEEHLVDYENKLVTAARSENYISDTLMHIREYVDHSGAVSAGDFTAATANAWAASHKKKGMAARTIQKRLTSIKGLSNWLTGEAKLIRDPFLSVSKPDPKGDRRRERRMLLPTEWPWLVKAMHANVDRYGITPGERLLVYRLAIQTGYRSGEVSKLGRGNFHLDGKTPFVRLASSNTKNKQTANQHIDTGLAADMRVHLATKTPGASAFALPERREMVKMLQEDLAVARDLWLKDAKTPDERAQREHELFLCIKNESGEELVFHSLRHTTGAWLAMRGVEAKVIQSVMRHCNINLTFDTYGHLIDGAKFAAIQANADMVAAPAVIAATGTDACVPFVSKPDAKPCVEAAGACEHADDERQTKTAAFKSQKAAKNKRNATPCESPQDVTSSAQGGDRTRTEVSPRRILSPVCLPIPPPGLEEVARL